MMEEPEVSLSNALRRLIQKRFTEKVAEKGPKSLPNVKQKPDQADKQPASLLTAIKLNRENENQGNEWK